MKKRDLKILYEFFEVDETVTIKELKSIYRNRAKELHPDNGGDEQKFIELNEKYNELLEYLNTNKDIEHEFEENNNEDYSSYENQYRNDEKEYNNFRENNLTVDQLKEIINNSSYDRIQLTYLIKKNLGSIFTYMELNDYSYIEIQEVISFLMYVTDVNEKTMVKELKKYTKRINRFENFKYKLSKTFIISGILTVTSVSSFASAVMSYGSSSYYMFPIAILIFIFSLFIKVWCMPSFLRVLQSRYVIKGKTLEEILFGVEKEKKNKKTLMQVRIVLVLIIVNLFLVFKIIQTLDLGYSKYDYSTYTLMTGTEVASGNGIIGNSVDLIGQITDIDEYSNELVLLVQKAYPTPRVLGEYYVTDDIVLRIDSTSNVFQQYLNGGFDIGAYIQFKGVVVDDTNKFTQNKNIPLVDIRSIDPLTEQEAVSPTLASYDWEDYTVSGITFSEITMEISPIETRMNCTVTNNSDLPFLWLPDGSELQVNGMSLYGQSSYTPNEPYPEFKLIIQPGESTTGVIQYPAIDELPTGDISWYPNI